MDATNGSNVRFCMRFFANKTFSVFLEGQILPVPFHSINLLIAFPLNENKSQLLATFDNCERESNKQSLEFLAVFEPEALAT